MQTLKDVYDMLVDYMNINNKVHGFGFRMKYEPTHKQYIIIINNLSVFSGEACKFYIDWLDQASSVSSEISWDDAAIQLKKQIIKALEEHINHTKQTINNDIIALQKMQQKLQ